ncbi:MAG TPA: hypothetical protein VGL73_12645 [Caulobacteraceae bacterium]|jgi:hypothetical protein
MIPRGSEAIRHLATRVAQDLIPKAGDAYTATDLGYVTALMGLIAQDYDRAADVLISEHAALQSILRDGARHLDDVDLKTRIAEGLATEAPSLRVSDLTARSDLTLKLLIDLQAAVEEAEAGGADWARTVNGEIWRFLEAHVTAHAYEAAL